MPVRTIHLEARASALLAAAIVLLACLVGCDQPTVFGLPVDQVAIETRLLPARIVPLPQMRTGIGYQHLTWDNVARGQEGSGVRRDSWRQDLRLSAEWRLKADAYKGTPFERFHLIPPADYCDQKWKDFTFNLSNCAPGNRTLNRGLWRELEEFCRCGMAPNLVRDIVTATLFLPGPDGRVTIEFIGEYRDIPVPTHFGKALLETTTADDGTVRYDALAWIIPSRDPPPGSHYMDYRVSVNTFERAAGEDAFFWLPLKVQAAIESTE